MQKRISSCMNTYLFFDWLQQEYSIAQMNRYILFLPNAKKMFAKQFRAIKNH